MKKNIKFLVMASMLAAIICATTLVVRIPSPTNGYVNIGDCFVVLSGWLLGPIYGSLAAGIGSMFADLFGGYPHYMPGTFVIKALMALASYYILKLLKKGKIKAELSYIISSVVSAVIMILGYFGYSSLILGKGLAAAASIPGNMFQGAVGIVSAVLLYEIIVKNKVLRENLILIREEDKNVKKHSDIQ
ncbi:MAG: ECF transporter S component [Clostridiales bacterium]|nr:ECF transporter S component [Clostridiales bacterium]